VAGPKAWGMFPCYLTKDETMTKQEARETLAEAREATRAANAAYQAAWRKEPTAKGYARVDAALDVLHQAEASERALAQELAIYLD